MVGRLLILLWTFAFFCLSIFSQSPKEQPNVQGKTVASSKVSDAVATTPTIDGLVIAVEDGDTITVQSADRTIYLVRLQAIDAPEFKQDNFKNSKKSLSSLVLNKNVKVIVVTKDTDGKNIGTVWLDGSDIGLIQLEKGMAWHYRRFAYEQAPNVRKQYADAQTKAQSDVVGIWSEKKPIPPWVFRGDLVEPTKSSSAAQSTRSAAPPPPGRKYILGPMGGCYYLAEDGHKVYVKDKSRCQATTTVDKP